MRTNKKKQAQLHHIDYNKDLNWPERALHAQQQSHTQELFACTSYAAGALLFITGGILYMPVVSRSIGSGWCIVIGSCLFLVGAIFNVLFIWESPDIFSAHFANLTPNTNIICSSFYPCASLPYLDNDFHSTADEWVLSAGPAGIYIAGSGLFELVGFLDLYRTQCVRNYASESTSANAVMDTKQVDQATQSSSPFGHSYQSQ
jgi:predicted membrane channel-forming protein YqfA (hemolysin III family)